MVYSASFLTLFMPPAKTLPAIVVVAYNRPASLSRLLASLARADYTGCDNIELIISIDHSDSDQVTHIARSFDWKAGTKRLVTHERRLGLKDHVLACGDLAREYPSVILLEDDLIVSPAFYQYSRQALAFYGEDPAIAGISLYTFIYNEFAHIPFRVIDDGSEVYFVQSAVSWGQIWTARHWTEFRSWFEAHGEREPFSAVPKAVRMWPQTSWKKYFNAYMAAAGKYFVVPRYAMSTNMGDAGSHFPSQVTHYTAPISLGRPGFRFTPLAESKCRYDAFFELEPDCLKSLAASIADFDFCVDLHGTKELSQMDAPYALTARPSRNALKTYGLRHLPPELNVILDEPGDFFSLASRESLLEMPEKKMQVLRYFFVRPFRRWF